MKTVPFNSKIQQSEIQIRFSDCNVFSHLDNTRYLDYFMSARKAHLRHGLNFDMVDHAINKGVTWVVSKHQIAYLNEAMMGEKVVIHSTILEWRESGALFEMRMWDQEMKKLKALTWEELLHVDMKTKQNIAHAPEINDIFKPFENPVHDYINNFGARLKAVMGMRADVMDIVLSC